MLRSSGLALFVLIACTPVDDAPSAPRVVDAGRPQQTDGPVPWNPDLGGQPVPPPATDAPDAPPADEAPVVGDGPALPDAEPPKPLGEPTLRTVPLPVRRVVILSIDGLRADALEGQLYDLPGFTALRRDGASTLDARTDPGRTVTLPNHTCMITGRPTDGPEGHGFIYNGVTDQTLHEIKGSYVASIFDVAHDQGLGTALVASKPKFDLYPHSYDAAHGAPDRIPPDHGRGKLDVVHIQSYDDDATLAYALEILEADQVRLLFIHLYECDSAGHGFGFDPTLGTPYAAAVIRQDARIQRLRAALGPNTVLLVTTDHGGTGLGHSDPTLEVDYTIPFLAVGAGVRSGADLYVLNAGKRENPGTRRAHDAAIQPIRNCEVGNLALGLLGLPPVPGSMYGRDPLRLR